MDTQGLFCLKHGEHGHEFIEHVEQIENQDLDKSEKKRILRCSTCHYHITHEQERIQVNEQHQHVFANPHGHVFHIGCFASAPGCVLAGEETQYFSWFPGYAWQIAFCGQCLALLGWGFHSQESRFFGLILDKLVSSSYKD